MFILTSKRVKMEKCDNCKGSGKLNLLNLNCPICEGTGWSQEPYGKPEMESSDSLQARLEKAAEKCLNIAAVLIPHSSEKELEDLALDFMQMEDKYINKAMAQIDGCGHQRIRGDVSLDLLRNLIRKGMWHSGIRDEDYLDGLEERMK